RQNEQHAGDEIGKRRQRRHGQAPQHYLRSFFLYIASIRSVTAKPPKMLMEASTTPTSPSHCAPALSASAAAISAPTMMTEEIALVTAMSGVCSAGVTDQTT